MRPRQMSSPRGATGVDGAAHRRRGSPLSSLFLVVALLLLIAPLSCLSSSLASAEQRKSNAAAAAQLFNSPLLTGAGGTSPSSSSSSSSLLSEMLSRSRTRGGSPPPRDICRPTGQISDAHCDYETVESVLNSPNFFDTLDQLRKAPYFRYYKVDLYRDCPFWVENGLCMSKDCTVQKTDETEIPQEYRSAHLSLLSTTPDEEVHGGGGSMSSSLHAANHPSHLMTDADESTCTCAETDFCHWEDEEWSPESQWVNLLENPERFTGYAGPSANRVWRAIYEENCFGVGTLSSSSSSSSASSSSASSSSWLEPPREKGMGPGASGYVTSKDIFGKDKAASSEATLNQLLGSLASPLVDASSEQCLEKRVFYRLISGLHASISIHICHNHLDQRTGKWAPNLECFISRIAHHAERLENVYFDYLVLVRALAKLAERLSPAEESQGQGQGHTTKAVAATSAEMERALPLQLARGLPDSSMDESTPLLASLLAQASQSPPTFDEQAMFHSDEADDEDLRYEFRRRFRNVSQIMDCVGCDKCRLWGKLQVNGLGTALKILFGGGLAEGARGTSNDGMLLQRSELVALINTVHRFGESLRAVETFREMYHDEVSRREREEEEEENGKKQEQEQEQEKGKGDNKGERDEDAARREQSKPVPPRKTNVTNGVSETGSDGQKVQEEKTFWSQWISICEAKWDQCLRFLIDLISPATSPRRRQNGKQEL